MGPVIVTDDEFASAALEAGLIQPDALASTKQQVEELRAEGRHISLAHALVKGKHLSLDQRHKLELKLRIAKEKIPERIGPFRLLKKVGEGGMGSVYLAEDAQGRKVALKVLGQALVKDAEGRARFRREAQAASELQHPHIVRAMDVGEADGVPYYSMEFCEGETLEEILDRDHKMPLALSLNVIAQAADGLAFAHERGIVHRDVKPGNIFLLRDGHAKVLDLGLSKNYKTIQSFHTMEGTALGTPSYLSPEQAMGITDLDGRTDQYALGATLYHMLTGIEPFEAPNPTVTMMGHMNGQLADLREFCPQAPPGLVDVMTRMMAKDPGDRYPDLKACLEDLDRVKTGQPPALEPLDPALSSLGREKAKPSPKPAARSEHPPAHHANDRSATPTAEPHRPAPPAKAGPVQSTQPKERPVVMWPWILLSLGVLLGVLVLIIWALSG